MSGTGEAAAGSERGGPARLAAIFTGCAAMAQHGVVLLLLGPVLPDLMREFSVRESLAGLLLGVGSFGFTMGPAVAGRLIDRRGVRAALLVGLSVEILVLGAFGVVPAFALAVAFNFLLRFGASFVETSVNVLPVTLLAAARPGDGDASGASMMNLMHTFFGVGALVTPLAVGLLVQLTGRWRLVFGGGAVVTAALLALAWAVRLPRAPASRAEGRPAPMSIMRDRFVLAGAFALFLYVGAEVGMSAWIVLYLRTRLALAPVAASAGLTLLWVGIMTGRSINSLLARKVGVRELVLVAAVAGAVCGFALLAAGTAGAVYLLLLLFGLSISGIYPNVMVSINAHYPDRVGQVTAVLTIAAAAGSMTFHPVIGALAQALGIVAVIVVPPSLLALLAIAYALATPARRAASGAASG